MKNKNDTSVRKLVICSLLASLTALLQISAALFPGPGHVLSAFCTLPIALAAFIGPSTGVMSIFVSTWLTLIIQPAELPILTLTTAPLGLVIGSGLHYSAKPLTVILIGTASLTAGMSLLTFGLGLPAFGPFLANKDFVPLILFYTGFAFIYSAAWFSFTGRIVKLLHRMGLLSYATKRE